MEDNSQLLHNNNGQQNALNKEFFDKLLKNQERELEVRTQEILLRKQADSNSFEFSKASLEAQCKDRDSQRNYLLKTNREKYIFFWVLSSLFILVIGIALVYGKDNIAQELIKDIALIVTSAFGGYGYAKTKKKNDDE